MNDFLNKGLSLGFGLFAMSKEKVEEWVEELVKKGEVAPQESRQFINQLLDRGEKQRQAIKSMVQEQFAKSVDDWGLVRKQEVEALRRELDRLREEVERLRRSGPAPGEE